MISDAEAVATTSREAPLAPRWHTALLVGVMLAVACTGMLLGAGGAVAAPPASTAARLTQLYAPLFVVQCGLALYVARVGRPRSALGALVGRGWSTAGRAAVDVAVALAGFLVIEGAELLAARALGARQAASVAAILPQTPVERLAWVVVAVTVGFSEELVYRGYLRAQLTAFARSGAVGIALSAALFGLAHGQQGVATMARFALYGVGLGAVAAWRRGIVACVVCHVLVDVTSGLLG